MARRRWSDEDKAEIRRLFRCGFTYGEIAQRFGVTRRSVALTARRYKLVSPQEAFEAVVEGSRGRPKTEAHKRKLAAAQRRRMKDASLRQAVSEKTRAHRSTEQGRAEMLRGQAAGADTRRGFSIPADKASDYRFFRKSKRLSAPEAGAVLGLIPRNDQSGAQA